MQAVRVNPRHAIVAAQHRGLLVDEADGDHLIENLAGTLGIIHDRQNTVRQGHK
jgi:hypothetical protein